VTAPAVARDELAVLRRAAPMGAVLLTALAVHAGLAPHLAVRGVEPDLLLVAVVALSAGRGARAGAAFGFAAGLVADVFLATPMGTSALAYTLLGHLVGRSGRPHLTVRVATLTGAAVAAGRLGTAMVATALGGIPFLRTAGLLHILGVAVVSAPLGIPALAAGRRFGRGRGDRR
jgi:rod shape-determining protein MreD